MSERASEWTGLGRASEAGEPALGRTSERAGERESESAGERTGMGNASGQGTGEASERAGEGAGESQSRPACYSHGCSHRHSCCSCSSCSKRARTSVLAIPRTIPECGSASVSISATRDGV